MRDHLMYYEGPEQLATAKGCTLVWRKRKKMWDMRRKSNEERASQITILRLPYLTHLQGGDRIPVPPVHPRGPGRGRLGQVGQWPACVFLGQATVKAPSQGSQGHPLPRMVFPGPRPSPLPALLQRRMASGEDRHTRPFFVWTTLMGNWAKNVQETWGAVTTRARRGDLCPGLGCGRTNELSFCAKVNWAREKICVKEAEPGLGCNPPSTWGRVPLYILVITKL